MNKLCPFCNAKPFTKTREVAGGRVRRWFCMEHRDGCFLADTTVLFCADTEEDYVRELNRWNHRPRSSKGQPKVPTLKPARPR